MNTFPVRPLILAATVLLSACSHKPDEPGVGIPTNAVTATVLTTRLGDLPITAGYPGSVVAEQQVQIASRIMGYVRQINVEVGQRVKQGDLLITVDPTDIQGQVNMSKASLAQAEAALADAKTDYNRFGELYREQAIPKTQWDKVRLQYAIAQQQAIAARAGHDTASAQLRYAEIRAPFSGIITQRLTSIGGLATPGQPLLALINPAKLDVETQVSETTYRLLQLGEPVNLHIDHALVIGKITHLVPAVDPMSHTHLVKIALPDDPRLQGGMFVQVDFPAGERQGLRIPSSAVIERAGIPGVFVVDSRNIAHYRMVRRGETRDGQTEIQAGLNAGEQVVDAPPAELQSGDSIHAGAGNV